MITLNYISKYRCTRSYFIILLLFKSLVVKKITRSRSKNVAKNKTWTKKRYVNQKLLILQTDLSNNERFFAIKNEDSLFPTLF